MQNIIKKMAVALITTALTAGLLVSCGEKKTESHIFRATITEINSGSIFVTPVEGSEELRSSDSFHLSLEQMPSSPEPQVGDIIEITYDGDILETYPAGLDHVISIKVVEKSTDSDQSPVSGSEGATSTVTIESNVPENSVLWLKNDEGAAKLMADMNEGRIPTECNVLYDAMGSRPDVTVTDPEKIVDLYERFSKMTVGSKSDMSITDCYHHISFHLQDGTWVSWSFEGEDLLSCEGNNYEVSDEGNLWFEVRALQEEAMGNEEVADYEQQEEASDLSGITISYGVSAIYSKEDMDSAIQLIKNEFDTWSGCELHSIAYSSDGECNAENIAWLNEQEQANDAREIFTQCIMFKSSFHSPIEGGNGWDADCEYTDWQWWLARSDGGKWKLMDWGY